LTISPSDGTDINNKFPMIEKQKYCRVMIAYIKKLETFSSIKEALDGCLIMLALLVKLKGSGVKISLYAKDYQIFAI
jgi:hypothetical protein